MPKTCEMGIIVSLGIINSWEHVFSRMIHILCLLKKIKLNPAYLATKRMKLKFTYPSVVYAVPFILDGLQLCNPYGGD